MDATEMRRRVAQARVARLATADAAGRPHLVAVVFAVDGDTVYFAVDAKPKRTPDLKRLRNIAANPSASLLVDHYEEDWRALWWVRVDGAARVVADADEAARAIDLLGGKYEQYRSAAPPGPVVAIAVQRITGWAAAGDPGGRDAPGT